MDTDKKDEYESLAIIVDKMNEKYKDLVDDDFNIGVGQRVVPINKDGKITGWKIQKQIGDIWVDECDRVYNTMEELINRNKIDNKSQKIESTMKE